MPSFPSVIKLEDFSLADNTASVAIGFFDGFHKGHRKLIQLMSGQSPHSPKIIFTFSNHPKNITDPENKPFLLTTFEEKLKLLYQTDVDYIVWKEFTREFSNISYEEFLSEVLIKKLNCQHIFVGRNFRFGKNAEGTSEHIKEFAEDKNLAVTICERLCFEGEPISSSRIRKYVYSGEMKKASERMGHNFTLHGMRNKHSDTLPWYHDSRKIKPPDGLYKGLIENENTEFKYESLGNEFALPGIFSVNYPDCLTLEFIEKSDE